MSLQQKSSTRGNADRRVQGTCLDSDLSGLLLGSTHNVALFTVEGWHVLGCHAHPVTGRLEQLLCNLLSHLCLGPRRCIHLVQLQKGMSHQIVSTTPTAVKQVVR